MNKLTFYAVVLGETFAALGIAHKFGLLRPRRVWLNGILWAVWGIVVLVSVDLLTGGFNAGFQPIVHVMVAFVGALSGALGGLLLSYISYLERRSAH